MKEAIRYMYPMVLWSVEVSQLTIIRPLDLGTTRGITLPLVVSAEYSRVVTGYLLVVGVLVGIAVVFITETSGITFIF